MKYFGFIKNRNLIQILLLIIILALHLILLSKDFSREYRLITRGLKIFFLAMFLVIYCYHNFIKKSDTNSKDENITNNKKKNLKYYFSRIFSFAILTVVGIRVMFKFQGFEFFDEWILFPFIFICFLFYSIRGLVENVIVFNALDSLKSKDYKQAINRFTKLLLKYPIWGFCFEHRGYAYHLSGDYNKAIEDFSKIVENEEAKPLIFKYLGISLKKIGHNNDAILNLRKYLNLIPDDSEDYEEIKNNLRELEEE